MLTLRALTAGYGRQPLLFDVNAAFAPGAVTCIVGPNGCGKTTLLRVAAGLLPPMEGQALLDGGPLDRLPPKERARRLAFLPQARPVPALTAFELALHGRYPHLGFPRRPSPTDIRLTQQAMAATGTLDLAEKPLATLSGGERQKVYLAMLLAQDAQTLLLDEPTTYLDVRRQLELLSLIRRLADQGRAVVLVLHDLGQALENADQIYLMRGGRLEQSGTPEEVYASGALEAVFGVRVERLAGRGGPRYVCARAED